MSTTPTVPAGRTTRSSSDSRCARRPQGSRRRRTSTRRGVLAPALGGQSHDEIASALGLSHGAVRGLIYRARATLRAAAAAVIPSPLVHWAARQELATGGRSAGIYEAIAGGSSAGLGGLLLKGGA